MMADRIKKRMVTIAKSLACSATLARVGGCIALVLKPVILFMIFSVQFASWGCSPHFWLLCLLTERAKESITAWSFDDIRCFGRMLTPAIWSPAKNTAAINVPTTNLTLTFRDLRRSMSCGCVCNDERASIFLRIASSCL